MADSVDIRLKLPIAQNHYKSVGEADTFFITSFPLQKSRGRSRKETQMANIPDYIDDIRDITEDANYSRREKGFVCEIGDELVCIPDTMSFIESAELWQIALDSIRHTLVDFIVQHKLTNYDEFIELVRENLDRVFLTCAYFDFEFYGMVFAKICENVSAQS